MLAFKNLFTNFYNWNKSDIDFKKYEGIPKNFYLFGKYFIQWCRKGYSAPDIFDLNDTLTDFIYPRIKEFHEKLVSGDYMGHPCNLSGMDEWVETVGKIVRAFYLIKELDVDWENWKFDREKEESRQKEIEEGLKLFAGYYESLWD